MAWRRPWPWPHCVRLGHSCPSQRGTAPPFSAHVCCGQSLDGSRCHLVAGKVLDGDAAPLPKKGTELPPTFGPCLSWPNNWMEQDATWYGGRPWPRPHCVRWGPSPPKIKNGAQQPLTFRPMSIVANGWMDQDATWYGGRPRPRPHCVRWGTQLPLKRGAAPPSPPIFGPCLLWPNG